MPGISQLNPAVMLIIISYLEPCDLAQFSAVCKIYHKPALRQLLASEIDIDANEMLLSFCECVLVDAPTRGPWITSLAVRWKAFPWVDDMHPDDMDFIVEIAEIADVFSVSVLGKVLRHCTRLKSLSLPTLGKLLDIEPQIGVSVASLSTLSELCLLDLDRPKPAEQLLRSMRSQLNSLEIWYYNSQSPPWLPFPMPDPATVYSLAKIEHLELGNMQFPIPYQPYTPWSSVRTFAIGQAFFDTSQIAVIFPGLKELFVGWEAGCSREDHWIPLWHELDSLMINWSEISRIRWGGCLVHRLEVEQGGYLGDFIPESQNMFSLLQLVEIMLPVVFSLNQIDALAGLNLKSRFNIASLRCLDVILKLPVIPKHPDFLVRQVPS